jgi:hypothetical protein
MASLHNLVLALIRQAKFQNAVQARRWFAAHISKDFALLITPFFGLNNGFYFIMNSDQEWFAKSFRALEKLTSFLTTAIIGN